MDAESFEDTRQVQCLEEDRCKPESNCSDSCKYSARRWWRCTRHIRWDGDRPNEKLDADGAKQLERVNNHIRLNTRMAKPSNVPRSGWRGIRRRLWRRIWKHTEDDEDSNAGGRGGRSFSYHLAWSAWPWQLDLWVYFDVVRSFGRPDKRTKVHLK
jgi:hypothetical protein